MQKIINGLISFVPAPVLAWINQYIDLFSDTFLASVIWQQKANRTAAAITTFVVMVLIFAYKSDQNRDRRAISIFAISSLLLTLLCFAFHIMSGRNLSLEMGVLIDDMWMYTYTLTLVSYVFLLTFAIRARMN